MCLPQFAAWVDAVVFVFSLEDEISFQTVYNYYLRLCSYRNTAEVPMVLVGTQGESGVARFTPHILPASVRSTGDVSTLARERRVLALQVHREIPVCKPYAGQSYSEAASLGPWRS